MHRKGNGHHEGQGNGKTGKDAARIRRPFLADLDAVMGLIRVCDLVAHGGPDLSEEELRTDWASMDLGRDAWLALGPSGEALCYVAVSEGGTGRIDVEFYARSRLAGGKRRRAPAGTGRGSGARDGRSNAFGSLAASPVPRGVLRSTVGGADGVARKLLKSVGYAFARGF